MIPFWQKWKEQQQRARFTTVTGQVNAIISSGAMDDNCRPKDYAKSLVKKYLIKHYKLSASELLPISRTSQNPTDPDEWPWYEWQDRLYNEYASWPRDTICYRFKSVEKRDKIRSMLISFGLNNFDKFKACKNLDLLMSQFGARRVNRCNNTFELLDLYKHESIPITPLIRACIQKGLFTRDFINDLYNVSKPSTYL
ncbi:hypothetical protein [Endozoicomonas sp. SCSIO W0465]|uniref:hypothetical protein n=1 Tax=Endozoicomonas sp. SCSIO W0465 TaxID=2918516 RepID=UPI00207590CE|nr:hypothetical protein [Endozoicomonas sp. SCSIO W0465]USE37167.1 hypothetical protein MJO57_02750 [Endozoicomonas sp. SCSIO W0465]